MNRLFLVVCCLLSLLAGCDFPGAGPVAKSRAPEDLMRVAVPGWEANGKQSVRQIASSDASGNEGSFYSLAPGLVITQTEDKIALIVVGTPSNEQGGQVAGHGSQALLGVYWFAKQGAHWLKVAEQANFAEEGFFGNPGELRQFDLGNGNVALAVDNGSCWQGSCMNWLALYALGENKITKVFADGISSDSENATNSCSDLLKLAVGQSMRVSMEDYSTYSVCRRITGSSKIIASAKGPGQLVINYSGKTTITKTVPLSDEAKATYANNGMEDDAPEQEYLVTVTAIQQKQIYNFRDGRYVLTKGKNPNPGL
jgi:hypothetical protein